MFKIVVLLVLHVTSVIVLGICVITGDCIEAKHLYAITIATGMALLTLLRPGGTAGQTNQGQPPSASLGGSRQEGATSPDPSARGDGAPPSRREGLAPLAWPYSAHWVPTHTTVTHPVAGQW